MFRWKTTYVMSENMRMCSSSQGCGSESGKLPSED